MKVEQVPQDDSILEGHRRICYAQDSQGRYVAAASRGWFVEAVANGQAQIDIHEKMARAAVDARAGRLSPLAVHMARVHMDVGLLASYTGLWSWRIRRHLRPAVFARLPERILQRYADALGTDVASLKRIPGAEPDASAG